MASDLSNIIKEDIGNTLESLLSASTSIDKTELASSDDLSAKQYIYVDVDFTFSKFETVKWKFYIPSDAATKFEFLMLGGIGDLKESIDDEIADAVNEIVSNMCGSMSTNINAQSFTDLGSVKFTVVDSKIVQYEDIKSLDNLFKFDLSLGDDNLAIFIEFSHSFLPYISSISYGQSSSNDNMDDMYNSNEGSYHEVGNSNPILSLLGEDSIENLKLLFDIKFKLSVRLGTKVVLLKDITNWDTGTIIELGQMVNEPLDILANGIKIGEGEAVIVEGKFGIKIKHIGDRRLS